MKIQEAITKIITTFSEGNIPKAISYSINPMYDVPFNKWSLLNRLTAILFGTFDARGFKQWKEVGRYVKKGTKSFPILAPKFRKTKDEDEEKHILTGFVPINVFRYEDTDGEPLAYETLEVPDFPLQEVAEAFGVSMKAIPSNGHYLGYYRHSTTEIALATNEEVVFFHELAHAADYRCRDLKPTRGQQPDREIIAELSACTLAYLVGTELPSSLGNHYQYIAGYAEKAKIPIITACTQYFTQVENVINEILKFKEEK